MKIAYLIMAHKSFDMLTRLVSRLNHENVSFFVHIDIRAQTDLVYFRNQFPADANIFFLKEPFKNHWGGYNLFLSSHLLMSAAVHHSKFDYISLLSGQDYPLKSNEEIFRFLEENAGKEFIDYFKFPYERWPNGGYDRIKYYWHIDQMGIEFSKQFVDRQKKDGIARQIPNGLEPHGGSMWYTITYDCAEYICRYLSNNMDLLDFFRYTAHPDEIILPTVVLNSKFAANVINNNLRYIDWSQNKPNPKTLTLEDLDSIKACNSHFARKFDMSIDSEILEKIDEHIDARKISPVS